MLLRFLVKKAAFRNTSLSFSTVKEEWAIISGFTKFAARSDLNLLLGEDIQPLKVEALLDNHSYFQGSWLLCLDASRFSVDDLRNHIAQRAALQTSIASSRTQKNSPDSEEALPMIIPGASVDKLVVKRVDYTPGSEKNSKLIRPASAYGISASTVRLRNVRYNVGLDSIKFFFREFELGPKEIERISTDIRLNQYLVHFASPAEAERAVHSLNLKVAAGNVMHLLWYQCCE